MPGEHVTCPFASDAFNPSEETIMFEGFHRRRIDVGETIINCVISGDGPPVLMLHGFPQNLAMWAGVAPTLAEAFTVICADLRGYGDSSKPRCTPDNRNYAFREMAIDQIALMQKLGFDRFHVVGHDRGGRTAHRMALDQPGVVASIAVLDIVPTYVMFMETDRHVAGAYWHWYFLSQPEPLPERMIALDPDFFYESCLISWGGTPIDDFDREALADYRRCWRNPEMIHGSCSDYRAAATIDLKHDSIDIDKKVSCPALVLFGSNGTMAKYFDIPAAWRPRCADVHVKSLPAGHFFVDQFPQETARILDCFIKACSF
jgi:haloacetate dehalogenase